MKKKNKLTQQDIVVLILGESDTPLPQSSIYEKVRNHPSFISNADHPERNISSVLTENKKKYFSQNKKFEPYTLSEKGREHYNVLTTDMKKLMLNNLDVVRFLTENHNIILHGAPGTGKTYLAREIAKAMCGVDDIKKLEESGQFKMVQFHPSYDYTDFVEGLRPTGKDIDGGILFDRRDGVFKTFCKEAVKNYDSKKYVFLIDEINRGDMSKIFGELFFSIDPGYRANIADKDSIKVVDTQYQNLIPKEGDKNFEEKDADPFRKGFYIPDNVYIIGTMNDIDRSVESMDFAMRRRFQFIEVTAESRAEGMGLTNEKEAYKRMTNLNNCIISKEIGLSKAYQIGGSYFLKEKIEDGKKISVPIESDEEFKNLWDYRLKGLLREYLRGEEESEAKAKLDKLKNAFGIDEDGNLKLVDNLVAPAN